LLELLIVAGIVFVLALLGADSYQAQIPKQLLFGWYGFIEMNLDAMQPNGRLIAEAIVCTIILALGAHYFCRWLWVRMTPDGTEHWRVRWTVTGLATILLLFVAGIATIGITHQTAWLFTMKGPSVIDSWGPRFQMPEVLRSAVRARGAVEAYFARTGRLPNSTEETGIDRGELKTSRIVSAMRIEDDGVVMIHIQHKDAPDGVIAFTPTVAGADLRWRCSSNLQRIYLPAECRD
jgi:hypothetical protein